MNSHKMSTGMEPLQAETYLCAGDFPVVRPAKQSHNGVSAQPRCTDAVCLRWGMGAAASAPSRHKLSGALIV